MNLNQLISRWEQVRTGLLTIIEKFSQHELDYVPFEGGYSVAHSYSTSLTKKRGRSSMAIPAN